MNAPTEPGDPSNAAPPPETNRAPEILGNAPRVVKVGVTYSFTPQATDPDGDNTQARKASGLRVTTYDSGAAKFK